MKLAIVFGGESFEHEISIVSAIALKKVIFSELIYIFCDKNRDFYLIPTDEINSKRFSSKRYLKDTKLTLKQGGFFRKGVFKEEKIEFDAAINIIHGADGEDGKIAALFDFFGVRYIGPGIEASVLSYNKFFTKLYATSLGVKVLPYEIINKNKKNISLPLPFIVKPLRLGSSIGVSVIKEKSDIDYALDVAFEFDDEILIEPFIEGVKEFNVAGCKIKNEVRYSMIEEPQKELFLDFDKKYLDFSRTDRVFEADIAETLATQLKQSFKTLYEPLFDGAVIRCDFFVIDDEVYLNEINPNPGSLANYLFKDFNALIQELSLNLPRIRKIPVEYRYINSIQSAKGKAQ